MKFVKIIFALLLVAVLFKFNLDNKESVSVVLYQYTSPLIPTGLLLMTTFVLGMIAASFGSTLKIVQLKRQLNKLQPETDQDSATKKKKKEKESKDKVVEPQPAEQPQQSSTSAPEAVPTPTGDVRVIDAVYEDEVVDVPEAGPVDLGADQTEPSVIELPLDPVDPAQSDAKKE